MLNSSGYKMGYCEDKINIYNYISIGWHSMDLEKKVYLEQWTFLHKIRNWWGKLIAFSKQNTSTVYYMYMSSPKFVKHHQEGGFMALKNI